MKDGAPLRHLEAAHQPAPRALNLANQPTEGDVRVPLDVMLQPRPVCAAVEHRQRRETLILHHLLVTPCAFGIADHVEIGVRGDEVAVSLDIGDVVLNVDAHALRIGRECAGVDKHLRVRLGEILGEQGIEVGVLDIVIREQDAQAQVRPRSTTVGLQSMLSKGVFAWPTHRQVRRCRPPPILPRPDRRRYRQVRGASGIPTAPAYRAAP